MHKIIFLNLSTIFMSATIVTTCGCNLPMKLPMENKCDGKNLNVEKFRNGDPIPEAKSEGEWRTYLQAGEAAWCYWDNLWINGVKYGKLYNWYAVNDPRGLAPNGWHIPSDDEWTILTDYLGGEVIAGFKMKSKSGWYDGCIISTNSSGFSGLPGGFRYYDQFHYIGKYGYWWSSTGYSTNRVWYRFLNCVDGTIGRYDDGEEIGMSVRCLKD
ncbi:MAG: fibrobacter succinogenes major paralogous domain-containing protein [Saprospiraceae bacterium]|nr:fibrobacter succinogenes major paralogous domain-containing protein [Saprospiraceae bacterium]